MNDALQIALDISLRDFSTFNNFLIGSNSEIFQQLKKFCGSTTESFIYLWGPRYSGRTHLLQACCHNVSANQQQSIYLPLEQHQQWTPDILTGTEQLDLICLDNIDAVAGNPRWEEALFHLYNKARANQCRMLCAAATAGHHIKCSLADLQSRLTWGLTLKLEALNDTQKQQALQLRAKQRGLHLGDQCAQFLLNHTTRDMGHLFQTLERLDHASLEHQRKLTIPFIKDILDT